MGTCAAATTSPKKEAAFNGGRVAYARARRSTVSCVVSSKTVVTTLRSSRSFEKSNSFRIDGIRLMLLSLLKTSLSEAADVL